MTGVGIVGCGVISDVYAAKLSSLPDVRVAACADLDPERARELAAKHGIPLALEPEKLLRHPDVDDRAEPDDPRGARAHRD